MSSLENPHNFNTQQDLPACWTLSIVQLPCGLAKSTSLDGAHVTVTLRGITWKRSKKLLHAYAVEGPDPWNLISDWKEIAQNPQFHK